MQKLIRTSTVPLSLNVLLKGQLSYLNKYYSVLAISGKGKDLEEVSRREGVPTVAIEMERNISVFKDVKSFWQLYRCFRKEKPQIVHSITPKAGLLCMTAAYFARVPVRMHTFTGLLFPSKTGLFKTLLIYMDKCLCFFATRVYPEGEGVKHDLIQYKITKKPLKVLANGNVNGIDTSHFSPDAISQEERNNLCNDLGIKPEDFVFIFVGRLVGDKGINEMVPAFVKFNAIAQRNKGRAAKLLLVGPFEPNLDPLRPETLKEINENPNILSVGFQADVRPYFSVSNVLVFPSYREGFPNVVLQAGAMGLPAIVSDINGCNEIIINGSNGLIIPHKDVVELKEAMHRLFFDGELRHKLQAEARQMISSRYKHQVVWKALLKEYQDLLE